MSSGREAGRSSGRRSAAHERYYNRGFITYRKSVTQAGQFAALVDGQGSTLHDLLGREYIDCLGGCGSC